jgi:hypothetical protein
MSLTVRAYAVRSSVFVSAGDHSSDEAGRNALKGNAANDCEQRLADTAVKRGLRLIVSTGTAPIDLKLAGLCFAKTQQTSAVVSLVLQELRFPTGNDWATVV